MRIPTSFLITQCFLILTTVTILVLLIIYLPDLNISLYSHKFSQEFAREKYNSTHFWNKKLENSALYGYLFFVVMFTIIVTLSSEILNTVDQVKTKSIKPEFCNYAGYVVMSLLWSEVFCKVSHKFVGKPTPDFYSRCWPDFEGNGNFSESGFVEKFKFSEIFEIRPENETLINYLGCSNYKIVDTTHQYFNQEKIMDCSRLKGLVQQGLYCIGTDDWDQSDTKKLISDGFSSFIRIRSCVFIKLCHANHNFVFSRKVQSVYQSRIQLPTESDF